MNGRKLVLIVALVLPSVALMAIPGSASASRAPAPTGTGTLTCSVEGGVSFHPALTYYPYPGGDRLRQVAEVGLQLTGCSGPDSNTPQPNPTAATVSFDGQTHLKYTKVEFMGHIMNGVGGCGYSNFDPDVHIGVDERWMGGSPVSKTHTGLEVETTGGFVSGHSFGSYPGPVQQRMQWVGRGKRLDRWAGVRPLDEHHNDRRVGTLASPHDAISRDWPSPGAASRSNPLRSLLRF
jgi:hypothetical protein